MGRRSTGVSAANVDPVLVREAVQEMAAPQTYVHTQALPAALWTVEHGLGKFPSVTVIDSAGSRVFGHVAYVSADLLTVTFSAPFGGVAYLN